MLFLACSCSKNTEGVTEEKTGTPGPTTRTATPATTPIASVHLSCTSYTNTNHVVDLAFDTNGTLWTATHGGAVRWDLERETYAKHTRDDGLPGHWGTAIAVAADGAVWFGPYGGASRFDGMEWTTYTTADGLADNHVEAIAVAPDGALWFGTGGGVSRFDGTTWTTYTVADGLASDAVHAIAVAPGGALWFGTNHHGVS